MFKNIRVWHKPTEKYLDFEEISYKNQTITTFIELKDRYGIVNMVEQVIDFKDIIIEPEVSPGMFLGDIFGCRETEETIILKYDDEDKQFYFKDYYSDEEFLFTDYDSTTLAIISNRLKEGL